MKLARLALAALFLGGTACSSVQTVRNPAQFLASNPDFVVVIYDDNSEVPISKPQMRGDSVVGTWMGLNEPVSAPMSQVKRIDAIQRDRGRTTLLVLGLSAVTVVTTIGFARAVQNHGMICDFFRPEDRQCYISSGDYDNGMPN